MRPTLPSIPLVPEVVPKYLGGETGSIHLSNAKVKNVKHFFCPFCCVEWCKMKQVNVINFLCYKI